MFLGIVEALTALYIGPTYTDVVSFGILVVVLVLLVEQDIFSAFHVADRGYVLETGKIVRIGRASELAKDPDIRRAYLGI